MDSEICSIALETLHSIVESELQLYLHVETESNMKIDTDVSTETHMNNETMMLPGMLVDMENKSSLEYDLTLLSEKGLVHSASDLVMTVSHRQSDFYYKKIQSVHWQSIQPIWLRLYCFFQLCKLFVIYPKLNRASSKVVFGEAYRVLDEALLISGGDEWQWFIHDRLEELDEVQRQSLCDSVESPNVLEDMMPLTLTMEANRLEKSRGLVSLATHLYQFPCDTNARDWMHSVTQSLPFLSCRRFHFVAQTKWNSIHFWRRTYGCRTVPVEIGSQYTHASWTMEHMTLDAFLDYFICHSKVHPRSDIGYIAQYELLNQFPALCLDLDLSEFETHGMMTLPARSLPRNAYKIWFGSKGTISPLHHDPNHNFHVQIVGYKRWCLISPRYSAHLQAHTLESFGKLRNTSQLDLGLDSVRNHLCHVIGEENVIDVTIGPGDMIFIPKGWWHYVCSESASISLSTWF